MEVLRVKITSWTASFRYPAFISGFQPSLPVPPLSTLYGLISASCGRRIIPDDVNIGFVFEYESKTVDLETIYEFDSKLNAKSNICKREILFNTVLYLYLTSLDFLDAFKNPAYQILLGRSSDLACIDEVKIVELEKSSEPSYKGTLLPFDIEGVAAPIHAISTHFSDTRPRMNEDTQPYYIIEKSQKVNINGWIDPEFDWGVFIYGIGGLTTVV